MKEFYIQDTDAISNGTGEVYISFRDDDNEEVVLYWNAYALLKDIPSLFEFARRGEQKEVEYYKEKYRSMAEDIGEMTKRSKGRPKK